MVETESQQADLPQEITPEQYTFAEEALLDFKKAIDFVVSTEPADDFDEYLSAWAVALGVLTHEVFSSVVELLRLGHVRGAYMIGRALLDYHIRLRHYYNDAKPIMEAWRASKDGNAYAELQKTQAYQDWSAHSRYPNLLKERPLTFNTMQMDEELRKALIRELEKDQADHERYIKRQYEKVTDSEEFFGWLFATRLFQSAFLYGDQAVLDDVIEKNERELKPRWESPHMSPQYVLADAAFYLVRIMETMSLFRGWVYGEQRTWRRMLDLFGDL